MGKKLFVTINGQKHFLEEEEPKPTGTEGEGGEGDGAGEGAGAGESGVDKMVQMIAGKVLEAVKVAKANEADEQKKKAIFGGSGANRENDPKMKVYTTRKGKDVELFKSDVENLGKWFQSFLKKDYTKMGEYHQKLEPLIEGSASEGGYLVPTVLYNTIIDILEDAAVVKPRAFVIDMTGMKTNQLNIDSIATKPIVQWGSENADKSTSSMTFGQISLTPYKLAAIVPLSTELRDDAPFNIVQIISKAFADAVAKAEDQAFINGSGSGRPTGLTTYTLGATLDAGGALSFDHINSIYWKVPQAYRNRGYWIMNSRTIAVVSNLKDSQNRPLLLESGIITEPGIPALKGRPVLEQNDLASATILFGDLQAYWIGQKMPMTIDTADQATVAGVNLWERNLIAVRVEERVDGELAVTRAFGSITNCGVS